MGREWKPGDVAMMPVDGEDVRVMRTEMPHGGWLCANQNQFFADRSHHRPRPLAVIDPEDIDLVASLWQRFGQGVLFDKDGIEAMQAALREFANPTPTPCGAVATISHDGGAERVCRCTLEAGHGNCHEDGRFAWSVTA